MRKVAILLTAAVCAATATQPAFAGERYNKRINPKDQPTDFLKQTALIPIKLVAVPTAFVVGAPVAVVKSEAEAAETYTTAWFSEYDNNQCLTQLMLISLPGQSLRLVGALGRGILDGSLNAEEGFREPFSAKSFSLEETSL